MELVTGASNQRQGLQVRIIYEDGSCVIEFYLGLFIGFNLIIVRYFI
jgi:hypothetical protein